MMLSKETETIALAQNSSFTTKSKLLHHNHEFGFKILHP